MGLAPGSRLWQEVAMLRALIPIAALALVACTDTQPPVKQGHAIPVGGTACRSAGDCAPGEICFQSQCVPPPPPADDDAPPAPRAHLSATPLELSFGATTTPVTHTLAVVLANDGEAMLTVEDVRIEPAAAPFHLEPLGAGPFWVRPGRSREIFVTYAPTSAGAYEASLTVVTQAPAVSVALAGN